MSRAKQIQNIFHEINEIKDIFNSNHIETYMKEESIQVFRDTFLKLE